MLKRMNAAVSNYTGKAVTEFEELEDIAKKKMQVLEFYLKITAGVSASSGQERFHSESSLVIDDVDRNEDKKCKKGHCLTAFQTPKFKFYCEECQKLFPMGTTLYGCRQCDYELCEACVKPQSTEMTRLDSSRRKASQETSMNPIVESQPQPPPPRLPPPLPPPNVPEPWTAIYNTEYKAYYFNNTITGETTWEEPKKMN